MSPDTETQSATAARIWQTLSKLNVNEHTQKKGRFTYLSWTWAWKTMMEHFPQMEVRHAPVQYEDDRTATVFCEVEIDGIVRSMWLPIMDPKSRSNDSLPNPTSRDISDARMRCMVKCFALFGLGLYIYAGEDLPSDSTDEVETLSEYQQAEINAKIKAVEADKMKFLGWLQVDSLDEVPASRYKIIIDTLAKKEAANLKEAAERIKASAAAEGGEG